MSTHVTPSAASCPRTRTDSPDLDAEDLLALLGDDYTRQVFGAVADGPKSGAEVADATDVSRATAYRRLNDLKDAGLVDSDLVVCEDGNHYERYECVADSLCVTVDDGDLHATIDRAD